MASSKFSIQFTSTQSHKLILPINATSQYCCTQYALIAVCRFSRCGKTCLKTQSRRVCRRSVRVATTLKIKQQKKIYDLISVSLTLALDCIAFRTESNDTQLPISHEIQYIYNERRTKAHFDCARLFRLHRIFVRKGQI